VVLAVEVCRIFVPRLRQRERSAIVNVGSGLSIFPSPILGIYPATKLYIDRFTHGLELENKDKIDVLLMTPLGITTEMTGSSKGTTRVVVGPFMVTPEEVVRSTLANLGRTTASLGALRHKVSGLLM